MCAAGKKKNERNEIVCLYCTQSDILLCGIARFNRGNKNKLRTFQPHKWQKINSEPQTKFTGSYKKRVIEFNSHHTKEILYVNTNFLGNQPWNTYHELVSDIDVEKTCF